MSLSFHMLGTVGVCPWMTIKPSLSGNKKHGQQDAFQRLPRKKRPKADLIDTALHGRGVISYLMMLNCPSFLVSVCINMCSVCQEQRGFDRNSLKIKGALELCRVDVLGQPERGAEAEALMPLRHPRSK